MNGPDRVRLQHMRDAAQEALEFSTRRTRQDLDNDQMLVRALSDVHRHYR